MHCMAGHVINPCTKFEDPTAIRSWVWVVTSPIGYHWQCVCNHCVCAVSRDLSVGANFSRIFEIYDPDLPLRYTTFLALRLRQMELFAKIVYGPVLKNTRTALCAYAKQNHVSIECCRKSFTTIFLGDHDFPLTASNFDIVTAFRAIFSHIFTARAQKRLFMKFWLKLWHHHSIPWPRFLYWARYFGDFRTISVDFCIG